MPQWHTKKIKWETSNVALSYYPHCFSFPFIPSSLCVSMFTPHPARDISCHLHFAQARKKNHRIVYDQAGMLLIKVTACLMYREHAVFKSVCADETIAHEWNYTAVLHWYEPCQEWTEARVGQTLAGHQKHSGKSVLSSVVEVKNWHLEVRLFSVQVIPKSFLSNHFG